MPRMAILRALAPCSLTIVALSCVTDDEPPARPDADALQGFDMDVFARQHPTMVTAIAEYFEPGRTVDDLFRDCLEVVVAGAAVRAATAR